jgi:hypothetical protein
MLNDAFMRLLSSGTPATPLTGPLQSKPEHAAGELAPFVVDNGAGTGPPARSPIDPPYLDVRPPLTR